MPPNENAPYFDAGAQKQRLHSDLKMIISYVHKSVGNELALVRDLIDKVLEQGAPALFEIGWALNIPEPLRQEIAGHLKQLSLDAWLHIEQLMKETQSPVLKAMQRIRLGQWPGRGILTEVRRAFRSEETHDLAENPPEAMGQKLNGALEMLRDPSDANPLKKAQEMLAFTREKAPLLPDGQQVPMEMLESVCKNDEGVVFFANKLAVQLETASVTLWESLRPHHYIPRSDGGTAGESEHFSAADYKDIADFTQYLSLLHLELTQELSVQSTKNGQVTRQAGGHLVHSVCEAAFLFFLRGRFKALLASVDTVLHDGSLKTVEEQVLYHRERSRKVALFNELRRRLYAWEKAAEAMEKTSESPSTRIAAGHASSMLGNLDRSLMSFCQLQTKANSIKTPRSVQRTPAEKDYTVRPMPERCFSQYLEDRTKRNPIDIQAYVTRSACSFTDRSMTSALSKHQDKRGVIELTEAQMFIHRHNGEPCLTDISHIPLKNILMPEDPALITANFLARQSDTHNGYIAALYKDFGIEEAVMNAKGSVNRIDFVHRMRRIKGRWRWLKLDRVYEQYNYLLVSRADAEALGIADRVEPLPKKERLFLEQNNGYCPPDPVMIRMDLDPPDDDGDDPPQPVPPPPPDVKEKRDEPVKPRRKSPVPVGV